MITSGGPASETGVPVIHPSRWWYSAAGGMIAAAVICIAFAVTGFLSLNRQISDFQRVPVPGQAHVTFAQPGGYVLYIERPGHCCSVSVGGSAPFPAGPVQVTLVPATGGPQVPVSTWRGATESYSTAGHQGQAAMSFTISRPGTYILATRLATANSVTDVAVGPGIGRGVLVPILLIIAGSLALAAGLATGVLIGILRGRGRRAVAVPPVC